MDTRPTDRQPLPPLGNGNGDGNPPDRARLFLEDETAHFTPALLRTSALVAIGAALLVLVVGWTWATVDPFLIRVMLSGAIVITMLSAFLAGNTFRLRDLRKRRAQQVRAGILDRGHVLATMPPKHTVASRFRWAGIGAVLGAAATVTTIVASLGDLDGADDVLIAATFGVVATILGYVAGTYSRPLD